MTSLAAHYDGALRCTLTHGPTGSTLQTDAPPDNHGKGETFSPTDLVASALGACMLTVMGIWAERTGIDLTGAKVDIEKHMASSPHRRIGRLPVTVTIPGELDDDERKRLERVAHTCPVHQSLHPDIDAPITFVYSGPRGA